MPLSRSTCVTSNESLTVADSFVPSARVSVRRSVPTSSVSLWPLCTSAFTLLNNVDTLTCVVSDVGRKTNTIIRTRARAIRSQKKLVLIHFPLDIGAPLYLRQQYIVLYSIEKNERTYHRLASAFSIVAYYSIFCLKRCALI